jgi:hypothetical protein
MKQHRNTAIMASLALMAMLGTPAFTMADDVFKARLTGFQETPAAVSTVARGTFDAVVNDDSSIAYELTYEGLEGTVTQGHIHFGQRGIGGGISVWLCQTSEVPAPPAVRDSTPTCPPSGTVTGMFTAANVIGPAVQGIAAGEFDELLAAMRRGLTYANVHTTLHPGGEIRGQIKREREEKD